MSERARPVSSIVAGRALSVERNMARLLTALFADVATLARYASWNTHDARSLDEVIDRLDRVAHWLDHVQRGSHEALQEAWRLIEAFADAREYERAREAEAAEKRAAA